MNVKPGDLAIVVSDGQGGASNAIGFVVTVVEPAKCMAGPGWIVKLSRAYSMTLPATGKTMDRDELSVPDAWLRPISGVPLDDEQSEELTRIVTVTVKVKP